MKTSKNTYFHVLVTAILIASLAMPLVTQSPDVAAVGPDELRQVNLYLKHDSNTDYFMNSMQEDPAGDTQVNGVTWNYGWWTGNVEDTEFLTDLYIEGTFNNGAEIYIEVTITNPSWSGSVDVTMQFLDNGEVVAETTETLNGAIGGGEENSVWRLPFGPNADGSDHHTFAQGHTMAVRMTADGGNVDVDYRNGDAHVEFNTDQIHDEDFFVWDVKGNDMYGQEFVPNYPDDSGLGIAHIWGFFTDTITFRDVDNIELIIEGPDGTITPDPINPESQDDPRAVVFHYNWSYSEVMTSEEDAGTYYVTIVVNDQSGNNITFEEELRFIMSKYGVYLVLADDESGEKNDGPGKDVTYQMIVYNAGLVSDTIEITHNILPGDWEALIEPEAVTLNMGDSETILLTVSIPGDEDVGESVEVKVTGTSTKSTEDEEYDEADDDLRTTTRVKPTAKVAIFFREQDSDDDGSEFVDLHSKTGNAEKGVEREFNFRVKNDSPGEDTITLILDKIPSDWSAKIIYPGADEKVDNVTLDGNDEVLLHVKITPASGQTAVNEAYLEITGVSGNNESVEDTAYLNITRTLGVVISTDTIWEEKLLALKAGIPNTIDFNLENTGNEDRVFDLDVDLGSLSPDEWSIELNSDSNQIALSEGESDIFSLDIRPTDNAVNREGGYNFVIIAEDSEDDNVRYEFTVTMNVETNYQLAIEITVREQKLDEAGDSVNYIIRVKSSGNSDVVITLELQKDKTDWDAQLNIYTATFEAGGPEKEFILTVTAPDPVDNKEECTVSITAQVLLQPETAKSVSTKTTVEKSDSLALIDTLEEYQWMIYLVFAVVILAVVLYFRSQQFEDEDDEYDYEDYEEEEDDWE